MKSEELLILGGLAFLLLKGGTPQVDTMASQVSNAPQGTQFPGTDGWQGYNYSAFTPYGSGNIYEYVSGATTVPNEWLVNQINQGSPIGFKETVGAADYYYLKL